MSDDSNEHLPGMAAHVSPFIPNSPSDLTGEHFAAGPGGFVATGATCALQKGGCNILANPSACSIIPPSHYVTTCKHCIKIEYYQFFGLNDDEKLGVANHEGDLSIVTVIYDPDQKAGHGSGSGAGVSVSHWIYGVEIRYDLLDQGNVCVVKSPEKFCTGVNSSNQNLELLGGKSPSTERLGDIALAQNNTVIFHADLNNPSQQNPEHPEVFVERGSHEFWSTANWSAEWASNHSVNDTEHTYLPKDIPNLGEIEHPNGELGMAVVNYLGFWGATGRQPKQFIPRTFVAHQLELVSACSKGSNLVQ